MLLLLGFELISISDYDAVANILNTHHYVETELEATSLAMNSGCDQEGGGDMNSNLVEGKSENFQRIFREFSFKLMNRFSCK